MGGEALAKGGPGAQERSLGRGWVSGTSGAGRRVSTLEAKSPVAEVVPATYFSADVGTNVGETRHAGAAGAVPVRRSWYCFGEASGDGTPDLSSDGADWVCL